MRPPSPRSAASAQSRHPQERHADVDSTEAETDRANSALYTITIARLRWDKRTQHYIRRRVAEGKTRREAIRCLKRYICREIYRDIPRQRPTRTDQLSRLTSISASNSPSSTEAVPSYEPSHSGSSG